MDVLWEGLGEYSEDILRCIRCGFCNSVCPTSNASFSYMASKTSRGRLVMLQSILRKSSTINPLDREFRRLIDLCFGCRRCLEVCPAGVRIPQLMWRVRNLGGGDGRLRLMLKHYGAIEKTASRIHRLSNLILRSRLGRRILQTLAGIDSRAPFPRFSPPLESMIKQSPGQGRPLAYFIDIFTNYHESRLGLRVAGFLERLGYSVYAPVQREAGTPLLEEGLLEEAKQVARFNVSSLLREVERGARILTSSPAAYLALKRDYPELLGDEDSRVVAENTVDVLEIIREEVDGGRIRFRGGRGRLIYHSSCFSKATGMSGLIIGLLESAGYSVEVREECCGIAGMWGMMREHYEEALDVGSRLFSKIRGVDVPVVSQSETCRLQISHHAGVRTLHPFEVLLGSIQSW